MASPALTANTSAAPSSLDDEIPALSNKDCLSKDEDLYLDKHSCFSTTDNASDFLHLRTSHFYSLQAGSCGFLASSASVEVNDIHLTVPPVGSCMMSFSGLVEIALFSNLLLAFPQV